MKRSGVGLLLAALICALPIAAAETSSAPVFDLENGTVRLNSGYTMPIMGLGTYSLSDEECYASVTAQLEAGGRLIDTAYMYHNEAAVGRAVRDSGVPREEVESEIARYVLRSLADEVEIEENGAGQIGSIRMKKRLSGGA